MRSWVASTWSISWWVPCSVWSSVRKPVSTWAEPWRTWAPRSRVSRSLDLTEPSHALEVEIAKLQLQIKALDDRINRIDMYGTQEVGKMESKIAVMETNIVSVMASIGEMQGDVKALLTFRALLFGGAAVVSLLISSAVTMVSRWLGA